MDRNVIVLHHVPDGGRVCLRKNYGSHRQPAARDSMVKLVNILRSVNYELYR